MDIHLHGFWLGVACAVVGVPLLYFVGRIVGSILLLWWWTDGGYFFRNKVAYLLTFGKKGEW